MMPTKVFKLNTNNHSFLCWGSSRGYKHKWHILRITISLAKTRYRW